MLTQTLLVKRERVAAQEAMEAPLARLHGQALLSLHEHDPAAHAAVVGRPKAR